MKEKCKTMIDSYCGTSKVCTPFVAGDNISIDYNLDKEVVISSTGGGGSNISQVNFEAPQTDSLEIINDNGLFSISNYTVNLGNRQSVLGTIQIPFTAGSGIVIDTNEQGDSIEIHTENLFEQQTIQSTSWSTLSDSSPYTYQAQVTLTKTLSENSVVELINNQAVLFATYGFAIASISGQVATIYSIGQPSENITLTLGVTE